MTDGQRNGGAHQKKNDHRENQYQSQRQGIAQNLNEFFTSLGKDTPHRGTSVFGRNFSLLPSFLNYADENVFEREALFPHGQNPHARIPQFLSGVSNAGVHFLVHNDVQPIAEQRDAPALRTAFQQVGG